MPSPVPETTRAAVVDRIRGCLTARADGDDEEDGATTRAASEQRIGIEAEWIVLDAGDRTRIVAAAETADAAAGPLPGGGRVTVEPGGQLELSADHRGGIAAALAALDGDAAVLAERCERAGLELLAVGVDPYRPPVRTLDKPRYRAMEEVFAAAGPRPMAMAASSASIQVNVDFGTDPLASWRLATAMGPVLLAMFANSPVHGGRVTGWKSTRQLYWATVPGGRGAPLPAWSVEAWVDRVLDTDVLYIESPDGTDATAAPAGFTFGHWLDAGHPLGWPTLHDLDVHLTTLFPPVRPRGWLELRMIDAVPTPSRTVACAVAAALLTHPDLAEEVIDACRPTAGRWSAAARDGLADPALAAAANTLLRLTADAIDGDLAGAVRDWSDRYAARGRCPADDVLDSLDVVDVTAAAEPIGSTP